MSKLSESTTAEGLIEVWACSVCGITNLDADDHCRSCGSADRRYLHPVQIWLYDYGREALR